MHGSRMFTLLNAKETAGICQEKRKKKYSRVRLIRIKVGLVFVTANDKKRIESTSNLRRWKPAKL